MADEDNRNQIDRNLVPIHERGGRPDVDNRPMMDFTSARTYAHRSCIAPPPIAARDYEIKTSVMQMIQNTVQFRGTPMEDPHEHLSKFLSVCDTFRQNGVSQDAVRLKLFIFSLKDKAWAWFNSLPPK
ncbi:hypothetical protein MLD38_036709 [Melastoma candidum]|uniref:Uncharacterized protein n=1 Tax=Melastoma candidum TaxID=119954 RepID=A0ACB9LKI2_9MYRT|nr:hypothetical protein MLD38_036709 [Melastoma candidum]